MGPKLIECWVWLSLPPAFFCIDGQPDDGVRRPHRGMVVLSALVGLFTRHYDRRGDGPRSIPIEPAGGIIYIFRSPAGRSASA
jgi:hypothetical protein